MANTNTIEVRQTRPVALTGLSNVRNPIISPLAAGDFLQEIPLTAPMREFLFQVRKDGEVYWVGAAVPAGVSDFSKAQVFFHPTVVNGGRVHAAEGDYPTFAGGWRGSLQRYVAMQGGQLAGVSATPLIVPFMTMASLRGAAPAYMFGTRATETLSAICSAVRLAATGQSGQVAPGQIGVSSFSSGIGAMKLFINSFGSSGFIVETTDFDSPFIKGSHRIITTAPGATGRVFSQIAPVRPTPGWVTLPAWKFKRIVAFRDKGAHAQIGWMTFFLAAMTSKIR
jgi:hypothetical protein